MLRIARIARTISGSGFPPSEQGSSEGDLPFVKVSDLARVENSDRVVGAANWVTTDQARRLGARVVPANSILFPKVGAALLGNARGHAAVPLAMDNNMMAVVPEKVDDRFLYWWLRSVDMGQLTDGGTLPFVSDSSVRDLRVPLSDPVEQRRIADFLDDRVARIDQIIAARQRQLELTAAHRSAELIARVFRLGDQMLPCRTMAEVRLGRQRSPEQENGDDMIPYLRSANVRDGEFDLEDVKTMNFTPVEQVVFQLRRGDVLVTEGSASADAVGASAAWMEDLPGTVCFQNTLIRLRSRSDCLPEFLEVWARASHAAGAAKAWSSGASILHLGSEGMGRTLMPRLPESEQRARVRAARTVLDEHARLRTALDRYLAALTEYKQSLITAAVTGELDVTTASSGIPG